jgi:nucleotide-binding universal stress UspA family protein
MDLLAIAIGGTAELFVTRAAAIGRSLSARLALVLAAPVPEAGDYAPHVAPEAVAAIRDEIVARASRGLSEIDSLVAPQPTEVRLLAAGPEHVVRSVVHAARHSDLALFPCDQACGNTELRDRLMLAVLDAASCPVLVVRDRERELPARRVTLAWNGSRTCSRAWRDAIRIVNPAGRVDLVIGSITAASRFDGVELAEAARRHVEGQGFDVEVRRVSVHPANEEWRPPDQRLLEIERATDADLLVMGAGTSHRSEPGRFSELTAAMIGSGRAHLLLAR